MSHAYVRAPLSALFLVMAIGAVACSSSSSETPPEMLTVSGQVALPAQLAQVPVAGAQVEVIAVDDLGNPIGEVLATGTTDASGNYTLDLPAGVALSANLIVRVVSGPAAGLRALAVGSTVNVSAGSEFLIRKLTAGGNSLASVTREEVAALAAIVDGFNTGGTGTIEGTIEAFGEQAAANLDPAIEVAVGVEGDSAAVAGTYHFVQFGLDVDTKPLQVHAANNGTFRIVGGAMGQGIFTDLSISTLEAEQIASPNGAGGVTYGLAMSLDESLDMVDHTLQVSAAGDLVIMRPQAVEIDEDVAFRNVAASHILRSIGPASFVGSFSEEEEEFGLTPGRELDPDNLISRIHTSSVFVTARQESVVNTSLNGATFGYIGFGELYESTGGREVFGDLGTMSFTSADATTGTLATTDDFLGLFRSPFGDSLAAEVSWSATGPGGIDDPVGQDDGDDELSYLLDPATGALSMTGLAPGESVEGFVGYGGKLVAIATRHSEAAETENGLQIGVRLGTANPNLEGVSYRIISIHKAYSPTGFTGVNRISNGTLSVTGAAVSIDVADRVRTKPNDLSADIEDDSASGNETGTIAFDGSNGQATITLEGSQLTGFFSADGTMGVFRLANSELDFDPPEAAVGIVILTRK